MATSPLRRRRRTCRRTLAALPALALAASMAAVLAAAACCFSRPVSMPVSSSRKRGLIHTRGQLPPNPQEIPRPEEEPGPEPEEPEPERRLPYTLHLANRLGREDCACLGAQSGHDHARRGAIEAHRGVPRPEGQAHHGASCRDDQAWPDAARVERRGRPSYRGAEKHQQGPDALRVHRGRQTEASRKGRRLLESGASCGGHHHRGHRLDVPHLEDNAERGERQGDQEAAQAPQG
mmetsp:Transcript_129496/g.414026  ORF Transcript_129496/g.414026 Transcript_129496/m.414026 type:complete len:235 (-) Transcript_129496:678-1382(-)